MAKNKQADGPITIKKYANRRLYNTSSSSYITLDDLAKMTREGVEFQVIDAKSGDDITHSILTQIIMEEEASGEQMLPVSFLRQLIGMYGNSMQSIMPGYLDAAMTSFRNNQSKLQDAVKSGMGDSMFGKMAETNLAMMRAATEAFIPGAKTASKPSGGKANKPASTATGADAEIVALKEQMAAMQKKLDELAK